MQRDTVKILFIFPAIMLMMAGCLFSCDLSEWAEGEKKEISPCDKEYYVLGLPPWIDTYIFECLENSLIHIINHHL